MGSTRLPGKVIKDICGQPMLWRQLQRIQNSRLVEQTVVATTDQIIESNPEHGWFGPTNLNRLLTEYPGAFGVKTGRTGEAGYALIGGAERDGSRLLVVVLGSDNHFDDAEILLDFGFSIVQSIAAGG